MSTPVDDAATAPHATSVPTADSTGYYRETRAFGSAAGYRRVAEYLLKHLSDTKFPVPKDEAGRLLDLERKQMAWHCFKILDEKVPSEIAELAVSEKWRAGRSDLHYLIGAVTRSRPAVHRVVAEFEALPAGAGFWEAQAALVAAVKRAEEAVKVARAAGEKPGNLTAVVYKPKKPPAVVLAPMQPSSAFSTPAVAGVVPSAAARVAVPALLVTPDVRAVGDLDIDELGVVLQIARLRQVPISEALADYNRRAAGVPTGTPAGGGSIGGAKRPRDEEGGDKGADGSTKRNLWGNGP